MIRILLKHLQSVCYVCVWPGGLGVFTLICGMVGPTAWRCGSGGLCQGRVLGRTFIQKNIF